MRKSFLNHEAKNEQMALQITSMADVFVIILVFLLKSYSVEGLPYEPTLPLNPPVASGRFENTEAMKLEVSQKALALAGKPVSAMSNFKFTSKDMDGEGGSFSLRKALARMKSDPKAGERLIVVADEGAPYETIKAVLTSAASEGFSDVQLAVSHAN